jgi:hypothetical protein
MRYALDTGFFFVLIDDPSQTVRTAWSDLRSGTVLGIVAGSVLFELRRHALVGRLASSRVNVLLDRSKEAFRQLWMDTREDVERAARLSHGGGPVGVLTGRKTGPDWRGIATIRVGLKQKPRPLLRLWKFRLLRTHFGGS